MTSPLRFSRLAPVALLGIALALPAGADPVVVELYTSQGCSSCPPADEILGELAPHEDVLALSLHVDYWDWIGWEDTFADPAFSARQRAYAAAEGSNTVYTPQFVVNGSGRIAGARAMDLVEMIDAEEDGAGGDVLRVASTARGQEVVAMATPKGGRLILVSYLPSATVAVRRGENAGRDITYHNVVRGWSILADWDGSEASFVLPAPEAGLHRAVLAQAAGEGGPGRILGAVRVD